MAIVIPSFKDNIVATKAPTHQQETLTISNDVISKANHNETRDKKKDSDDHGNNNIPESRNLSSISKSVSTSKSSEEIATVTVVTSLSKFCVVMGIRYKIGDKLPHNTGNCVECICGEGAKISCSPHQCSPLGEEMNDYRPPEPRLSIVDNF
ncbi:hypothetical protein WA026_015477 [Henosepilachna vigintioctopunctata]|uniref:Kielin/chordin-like protein n=1 Tax=Henosepilachna vigintioctopunctata TaxID=420089 RepID=A0AAW1UFR6_9CUCU